MIVFTSFNFAYGAHGGSGGCSGDCIPPVLGIDQNGVLRVDKGIMINQEAFAVDGFSQTIPTQILTVGGNNTISLKVYENSGAEFVTHAELHFNIHEKRLEGVMVEKSEVAITWDNTNGEVYGVYGDENKIKNISINRTIQEGLAVITFKFEFTEKMEQSTMMVEIWDQKRNSSKNYFVNAIEVIEKIETKIETRNSINEEKPKEIEGIEDEKIPKWIKHTAGWWAKNQIDDKTFVSAIKVLVKESIIKVSENNMIDMDNSDKIPKWVKNNAGWWSEGMISDREFVKAVEFLINR